MDNRDVIDNILPACVRNNSCECFETILKRPSYYDPKDVLQYTTFNQTEIQKYLKEIAKHQEKDRLFSKFEYQDVEAREVKQANDHFLETVRKFQLYLSQTKDKGECVLQYFNKTVNINSLVDFYEHIGGTAERSVVLFNQPNSLLHVKFLIDTLDIHLICLYIFYQYHNLCVYGKPIYNKDYNNTSIVGIRFV